MPPPGRAKPLESLAEPADYLPRITCHNLRHDRPQLTGPRKANTKPDPNVLPNIYQTFGLVNLFLEQFHPKPTDLA